MDFVGLFVTSLREENDRAIAQRLKAKDPEALADAYDLYGRIAFALILRTVHDRAVAEDLVQETFLRVWNRSEQISDTYGVLGPWLLAIARNMALDHVKSSQIRHTRHKPVVDSDMPPITIDHEIALSEQARLIHEALQLLTPQQRQVVELAYYEGLSQQEVALRLGEPLGTIKGRMRLALQRLRNSIDIAAMQHA